MMKTLKVKAVGTSMCPDFDALDVGMLRFVGRKHDPSQGVNGGWVPLGEPVEIPYRAEYVQEIKAGTLIPCDEETARTCGVPFKSEPPKGK